MDRQPLELLLKMTTGMRTGPTGLTPAKSADDLETSLWLVVDVSHL